ncbi:MAG: transposase [Betaproteobacteria bacterium]|nr:transposase [Betaproteobacteria bacterium]
MNGSRKTTLARFIVEVVDRLDVSALEKAYAGRGSAAYHPPCCCRCWCMGTPPGCSSSRKLERATYDSVAFRFIAAGTHPDHDTLATFRRRFRRVGGVVRASAGDGSGNEAPEAGHPQSDGTKVKANASRHSALSHGHIEQLKSSSKRKSRLCWRWAEQADHRRCRTG